MTAGLKTQQLEAYNGIMQFLSPRFNDPQKFFVLRGSAGVGKTYLLGEVIRNSGRFGSAVCTPTNKATKVAQATIGAGLRCKTIYSLLGVKMVADEDQLVLKFPHIPVDLSAYDTIYVDESSMLSEEMVDYVVEMSERYATKWIFIGDPIQLPPVGEDDSKVWTLDCPGYHLTEVVRFDNQILNLATHIRRQVERFPRVKLRLESDHDNTQGVWKYDRRGWMRNIERGAKRGLFTENDHTKVVAWRNSTVSELNEFIRFCIFGREADVKPWLVGDRIMIGEPVQINGATLAHIDDEGTIIERTVTYHSTYKDLNTFNVTVQIDEGPAVNLNILHPDSEQRFQSMLNRMAEEAKRDAKKWKDFWMLKNSFHKIRYSYAMTTHRVQGSTYKNVFIDTTDILANSNTYEALRSLYVGATRATTMCIMV